MTRALDAISAKIERAREHVELYNAEFMEWGGTHHANLVVVGVEIDVQAEQATAIARAVDVAEIPPRLGAILGDAVHNYRSALDQLVFEISFVDSGGKEPPKSAFPDSKHRTNFWGSYVQNILLEGINKTHRARFLRYQPYRRWKNTPPGSSHPMEILSDLSNDDKHRLVQPHFLAVTRSDARFDGFQDLVPFSNKAIARDFFRRPLHAGTELMRIPIRITGPNPQMNMQFEFDFSVCLSDGMPVRGGLAVIDKFCVEAIDDLGAILKTKKAHRLRDLPRVGRFPPMPESTLAVTVEGEING